MGRSEGLTDTDFDDEKDKKRRRGGDGGGVGGEVGGEMYFIDSSTQNVKSC